MGSAYLRLKEKKALLANLWVQALGEVVEDAELRRFVKAHLREVHAYVAGVIRRAQAAGGVVAERDPDAEAWIFIAIGLLGSAGRRVGGLVGDEVFQKIVASRRAWLTSS
jgi:hypothetical protein